MTVIRGSDLVLVWVPIFSAFLLTLTVAFHESCNCYREELVVKCSNLDRKTINGLHLDEWVDVWKVSYGGKADFRVTQTRWQELQGGFSHCEVTGTVEEILIQTTRAKPYINDDDDAMEERWFMEYHSYKDIVTWYSDLASLYPTRAKFVESIGESVEGRKIPAFHITTSRNPRKFFFQCQLHAREWISGAVCSYIAHYLVRSKDTRVKDLLNKAEFIIVPVLNPDGYEHSQTKNNRLWRKNRRKTSVQDCQGVDLNRNYPEHWGEVGSSKNPCSDVYHGQSAASEPETKASMNYFEFQSSQSNPIIGAIDFHSYGELVLRPYGWGSNNAPDEPRMGRISFLMAEAMNSVNKRKYTSRRGFELYTFTGSAQDWFYSSSANGNNGGNRTLAYTLELPDAGFYGFLMPPSEIIPIGKEVVAGVLVFAEKLLHNESGPNIKHFYAFQIIACLLFVSMFIVY